MRSIILKSIPALLFVFFLNPGAEESPDGLEIIKNVYNRASGEDMKSSLTMKLINSRGDTRERSIKQYLRDVEGVEKKLMFFTKPADVRNTSFMNWSYDDPEKDDDQWIYLPALKRIKRISSSNKNDYFMGSDFTYDDLGERHPNEDVHKVTGTEDIEGKKCYIVRSEPKDKDYIYSHTVTWVLDGIWIGWKKEFYDKDGKHLKTLQVKDYKKIDGYWTVLKTKMHNVQKDHTTVMDISGVEYDTGISDSYFNERTMKRGIR